MLIGKPPFETTEVKKTYQRIKRNAFSFPDYIPISDSAKSLISRLLVLEPCKIKIIKFHILAKRLNLDGILEHPFMNNGTIIPDGLPVSIRACPPSLQFIRQH